MELASDDFSCIHIKKFFQKSKAKMSTESSYYPHLKQVLAPGSQTLMELAQIEANLRHGFDSRARHL